MPSATDHALAAPQAGLISALAQGVLQHNIDWSLIWLGAASAPRIIVVDEVLGLAKTSRAPAAAGGGPGHLPAHREVTLDDRGRRRGRLVFRRRAERSPRIREATKQLGVLMASGLIVGESIIGVIIAAIVVFSGQRGAAGAGGRQLRHRPRSGSAASHSCWSVPCSTAGSPGWAAPRLEVMHVGRSAAARRPRTMRAFARSTEDLT